MHTSYLVYNFFIAEFLPRLFLDKDEDYKELSDLIILNQAWLMTAMKDVVELGSKNAEYVKNDQVLKFEKDSIADLDVFTACWKHSVESLPKGSITVHQLCLIFQAYCLIFPVQAGQLESQKFIVPCKLPFTIKDEQVYKVAKSFPAFYFYFSDFLPDEVYHRLICFAWKNSTSKMQGVGKILSKRSSFFSNLFNANCVIEQEHQRLKIMIW